MTDSWEGFDNSFNRIMEPADIADIVFAAAFLSKQALSSGTEAEVARPSGSSLKRHLLFMAAGFQRR
mgnify:CR=1 FL=1